MKIDTTWYRTVSAGCDAPLTTDINPLSVRGSFISFIKSLNTIIDFCSISKRRLIFLTLSAFCAGDKMNALCM